MKRLLIIPLLLLTACATTPQQPPTIAYNAKEIYHGAQEAWLATCPANGSGTYKFCHDPNVVRAVQSADNAANAATLAFEQVALALCPTADACKTGVNASTVQLAQVSAQAAANAFAGLLTSVGVTK